MNLYGLSTRRALFYLLVILGCNACTGTEIGNPKVVAIDTDSIYIQKADMGVRMVGEEKAVTPGGSKLRIVDLDTVSEPVDITVNKDGSFKVDLAGAVDHVYRLRAMHGQERSKPVNVSGVEIEEIDCIEAEPSEVLQFPDIEPGESATRTITLSNVCDDVVTLIEQGFRLRSPAIEMQEQSGSVEIKPGRDLTVELTFSPELSGSYEAIALFRFADQGRVVIDVVGKTPGKSGQTEALTEAKAGVCYGEDTNCEAEPEVSVSGYPFAQPVVVEEIGDLSVDWYRVIDGVDCPLPPCYLVDPEIAVAKDGSVSVAAAVVSSAIEADKNTGKIHRVGVWFGRYSFEGEEIHRKLIAFQPPTQNGTIEHDYSIAVDSKGFTYFSHLPLYRPQESRPESGELDLYRFDSQGQRVDIPITRYGIQKAAVFVDPEDHIILVTHYRNPDAPDVIEDWRWIMSTLNGEEGDIAAMPVPTRVDISEYDRSGNLQWNQTILDDDALLTIVSEVAFDARGNLFATVNQMLSADERVWHIVRLDPNGNVEMKRLIPNPETGRVGLVKMAVFLDGGWSILSSIETIMNHSTYIDYIPITTLVDRYSSQGAVLASWDYQYSDMFAYDEIYLAPLVNDYYSLISDSKANSYVLINPSRSEPPFEGNPILSVLNHDRTTVSLYSVEDDRCITQAEGVDDYKIPVIYDDPMIASMCGIYSLHGYPANGVFFTSVYATGIFDSNESNGRYMFRWSNASDFSEVTGVIAIGKLSQPAEF